MHSTVPMKARDIAPGRWPLILADVGIDPAFLDKKEGPCPMCGGSTRFFSLTTRIRKELFLLPLLRRRRRLQADAIIRQYGLCSGCTLD
ncbi:primase-helicase zinc-binding domain-containing protein [Undibacterium arcticum]